MRCGFEICFQAGNSTARPSRSESIRALTITQPWASLIAGGAKQLETRSWPTRYRGPLAIHAAKTFPRWARALCSQEPYRSVLAAAGIQHADQLPRGMVVATCELTGVTATTDFQPDSTLEAAFGNYTPGRYAFRLTDVRPLDPPKPATGALGLWTWQPTRAEGDWL